MKKIILLVSVAFFIAGFVAGKFIFPQTSIEIKKEFADEPMVELRNSGYKFISPLLECEDAPVSELHGMVRVRREIEAFIKEREKDGQLTDAAVYFRDMANGPWFGINESADFSPASLLKLPVMMAYYKKAESDPGILKKKVRYEADSTLLPQAFLPKEMIVKGKEYTIEELIERMIIYSDNAALVLLEQNIDVGEIDRITMDLGIETATDATPADYMSVKGYSGLFRILYNASYLQKNYSEKILDILSKTQFDQGLEKGVPRSIVLSHKFGERELENGVNQLHDCGIIYVPRNPYLLCVMTRGTDLVKLQTAIAGISSITYRGIEERLK